MNAKMNNVELVESEMITSTIERDIKRLINRAQKEVLEVCAKEYNFDINAAMLLVGAGAERKERVVKEKVVKEKVVKEAKAPKEKKERAKKAVKELIEGEVEGDRKRNCSRGRPKNPEKVVEVEETENLFETLVNTHMQKETDKHIEVEFQTKDEKKTEECAEKVERLLMLVEEKDTKLVNKMEAKEQAKLAKDQAKEQEKLAKEQAKEAEKLAKEQAKEAEKLAKEQAKLAKEQAKSIAGEKKLKVSATKEKKTKVNTKKTVEATTSSKVDVIAKESTDVEYQTKMIDLSEKLEAAPGHKLVMPVVAVVAVVAEAPATLKVKSFKFEGVTYFREKTTGAIYDKETNDHLGQWNETTQKIDFLEPEEELEEEEESAGESSDEEEEEEDA
jgi:hypothetical protein